MRIKLEAQYQSNQQWQDQVRMLEMTSNIILADASGKPIAEFSVDPNSWMLYPASAEFGADASPK